MLPRSKKVEETLDSPGSDNVVWRATITQYDIVKRPPDSSSSSSILSSPSPIHDRPFIFLHCLRILRSAVSNSIAALSELTTQYVEYRLQVSKFLHHTGDVLGSVPPSPLSTWLIKRRYSEFREVHTQLRETYPVDFPTLPSKRLFGNFDPSFIATRLQELQLYINSILAVDPSAQSVALRHFLTFDHVPLASLSPLSASPIHPVLPFPQQQVSPCSKSSQSITPLALDEASWAGWVSPNRFSSPATLPPTPPSSPTVISLPSATYCPLNPYHLSLPHPKIVPDALFQKTKDRFLDLTEVSDRWLELDASDLDSRTKLYRTVLMTPLPKRLWPSDDVTQEDLSANERPLIHRPIPQCLWNKLREECSENPIQSNPDSIMKNDAV